jgi:hypothetical protein
MSATLNFNPVKYYSWKGKTFSQITTSLQKNAGTIGILSVTTKDANVNLFNSRPLKIYRRELATQTTIPCSRNSVTIDELNMPNGYIVNPKNNSGLVNTLDINLTTNQYERADPKCNTLATCMSQQANARRRVRSSGMIRKDYDPLQSGSTVAKLKYYTNTSQYLNSRNMTYQQNQTIHVKSGDINSVPGTPSSASNVYSTNSVNSCVQNIYYKPSNPQFAEQGAVSSSSRILRKKFDTITTVGSSFSKPYGMGLANALSYGVPYSGFNLKDKIGYPQKCTPAVTSTGQFVKIQNSKICKV